MTTTTQPAPEPTDQASPEILAELENLREDIKQLRARVEAEEARRR